MPERYHYQTHLAAVRANTVPEYEKILSPPEGDERIIGSW